MLLNYIYHRAWYEILVCETISIVICAIVAIVLSKKHGNLWAQISRFLTFITLIAIYTITLLIRRPNVNNHVVLIPFQCFNESSFHTEIYRTMEMNVFLFFPYGLFLPYALPERVKHPIRITIFSALFFSLAIETIQLIFRLGTCETDDVIMNTLGATIGSLSYILSNWLRKWKEKRKSKST